MFRHIFVFIDDLKRTVSKVSSAKVNGGNAGEGKSWKSAEMGLTFIGKLAFCLFLFLKN